MLGRRTWRYSFQKKRRGTNGIAEFRLLIEDWFPVNGEWCAGMGIYDLGVLIYDRKDRSLPVVGLDGSVTGRL